MIAFCVGTSELKPLIKVKDMLLRHKDNVFNYSLYDQ